MELGPLEIIIIASFFWLLLYLLDKKWPLKKYGLEVGFFYIIRRTKRLNSFLKKIAEKHPIFWNTTWNIGIAVAFGQIGFALYTLTNNLHRFLSTPVSAQPVFLLLPGITVSLTWFPYLMTAIALTLISHELSHGIAACAERLKVKSAGIIFAFITIGGFVEPDEEQFQKLKTISKLRIISSGSFSNLTIGIVALLLMNALLLPASGVLIQAVQNDGPAFKAGLRSWDVVYSINNTEVNDVSDLGQVLGNLEPDDKLIINSSRGLFLVIAEPSSYNKSGGTLGIQWANNYPLRFGASAFFTFHLRLLFEWILLVLVNVSIFNMLPLYPLDGDAYIWALIEERSKRAAKITRIVLSAISLVLLASNVILTFMNYGFTPF